MPKPLREVTRSAFLARIVATGVVLGGVGACEPTVVIGDRFCAAPPSVGDAGAMPDPSTPVPLPFTTGFETGFCDYGQPLGFCYATSGSSFRIVTSPVHSGRYAAAFSAPSDADGGGQARCVEQGVFPVAAYYSAYYLVPAAAVVNGNWNLLHFQGGDAGAGDAGLQGLWDVSLVNGADGGLYTSLFDFLPHPKPSSEAVPPIPIGQWFRLEVYFRRAKDSTGEIVVMQDGKLATSIRALVTDYTQWGQFYVGNLAGALTPPASTVYVDDITIASSP